MKHCSCEPFSLLIKPASFDCNLRCSYCFYLSKKEMFGDGIHRMTMETLETVIRKFSECTMGRHLFAWHGGEPTLMGLDFFKEALRIQQKYFPEGNFENAFQTNGTMLDGEWCRFFGENHFLVGVSIDGPAVIHNRYRRHDNGLPSHANVIRGIAELKKNHVEYNSLTLVSSANQDSPEEVYEYLKSLGIYNHQYIDCVEFNKEGRLLPFSLSPGKWGEFLCRVFDVWYPADTRKVSIRLFDSILSRLVTGIPTICPMGADCCNYLTIEHNGSVYPCDFNVANDFMLGNISVDSFADIRNSEKYVKWGAEKMPTSNKCMSCRYMPLCMGDCPKNRSAAGSVLCEDWQMFYSHTIERFEILASQIESERL